jgi:ankyrin repeat protein
MENLKPQFDQEPCLAHIRSYDGRGPLFWAYEFGRHDVIHYLKDRLADEEALDIGGKKPAQLVKTQKDFDVGFRPAEAGIEVVTEEEKRKKERRRREKEKDGRRRIHA